MTIFKLVFSNRPFFILTILYGVMTFAIALITAGLPFAALYLILDDGTTLLSGAANALSVLSLMFAAFVIGSILSQAVWVLLSSRLGKLGALVLGLSFYILLLFAIFMVFPSTDVTLMALMFVLEGWPTDPTSRFPGRCIPT